MRHFLVLLTAAVITMASAPVAAQKAAADNGSPDVSATTVDETAQDAPPVAEDTTPAVMQATCGSEWDWYGTETGAVVFSRLKPALAKTVDVGLQCGPIYYGCEGYCANALDLVYGRVIIETTTTGWVFYKALGNIVGFTDGRQQWVWESDSRPPLVLGPPHWFCLQPKIVATLAIAGCS